MPWRLDEVLAWCHLPLLTSNRARDDLGKLYSPSMSVMSVISEGKSEDESGAQSDDDAELHSNLEEEAEFPSPSSPPTSR